MRRRQFLLLLCGGPATGKTSTARALLRILPPDYKAAHIQTDAIRMMVYNRRHSRRESRMVYEMLRNCSKIALTNGYSVIADATFTKRKDRQVFAKLAHETGSSFLSARLHCSLRVAILRNSHRSGSKFVPRERLISIHNNYEDDDYSLVLDTSDMKPEAIASLLLRELGLEAPVSPRGTVTG